MGDDRAGGSVLAALAKVLSLDWERDDAATLVPAAIDRARLEPADRATLLAVEPSRWRLLAREQRLKREALLDYIFPTTMRLAEAAGGRDALVVELVRRFPRRATEGLDFRELNVDWFVKLMRTAPVAVPTTLSDLAVLEAAIAWTSSNLTRHPDAGSAAAWGPDRERPDRADGPTLRPRVALVFAAHDVLAAHRSARAGDASVFPPPGRTAIAVVPSEGGVALRSVAWDVAGWLAQCDGRPWDSLPPPPAGAPSDATARALVGQAAKLGIVDGDDEILHRR